MTRQEAIETVEHALQLSEGLPNRERAVFIVGFLSSQSKSQPKELPQASEPKAEPQDPPARPPARPVLRPAARPASRSIVPEKKWEVADIIATLERGIPRTLDLEIERFGGGTSHIELERNIRAIVGPAGCDSVVVSYYHPKIGELEAYEVISVSDESIDTDGIYKTLCERARIVFRDRTNLKGKQPMIPVHASSLEAAMASSRQFNSER